MTSELAPAENLPAAPPAAEIVVALHPPRLPAGFAAAGWPDLLATFGLGLLAAAALAALLGPALRPRLRPRSLREELDRLRGLPPGDRLVAQLRLARARGVVLPPELRAALYGATPPDPDRLDRIIGGGGA